MVTVVVQAGFKLNTISVSCDKTITLHHFLFDRRIIFLSFFSIIIQNFNMLETVRRKYSISLQLKLDCRTKVNIKCNWQILGTSEKVYYTQRQISTTKISFIDMRLHSHRQRNKVNKIREGRVEFCSRAELDLNAVSEEGGKQMEEQWWATCREPCWCAKKVAMTL